MRYGRCYGLECGHHTAKEFTDIPLDNFGDITIDNKVYWNNLISHYYNFTKMIPGIDSEHCPKCNDIKRIVRMHVFVEFIADDGSNIKT